MNAPGKSLIDAFHAELLVEVQQLSAGIADLKSQVPSITADIQGSAEGVKSAAKQTLTDFEAMGLALMNVMRRHVAEEREAAGRANAEAAKHTKSALEGFTKYLWLLLGVSAVNTLLLAAILISKHQ